MKLHPGFCLCLMPAAADEFVCAAKVNGSCETITRCGQCCVECKDPCSDICPTAAERLEDLARAAAETGLVDGEPGDADGLDYEPPTVEDGEDDCDAEV